MREGEKGGAQSPMLLLYLRRLPVIFHLRGYTERSRAPSMRKLRIAIRRCDASQLRVCFLSRRTVRTRHGRQKLREGGKIWKA